MLESTTLRLLERYGTACTVKQVATTRTATNGVTTTTTLHTGRGYKQASMKDIDGLNPSAGAKVIVQLDDDYIITTKDIIVIGGRDEKALSVHVVTVPSGVLYQVVEV